MKMKIRLGPAGIPSICTGNTSEGIKALREIKLHAMEIQFGYGYNYMTLEKAKNIGTAAKENGIQLSIHAPYYINLLQQDKAKLEKSLGHIYGTEKRAHLLGAKIIVFHPGSYMKLSKEEAFDFIHKTLSKLSKKVSSTLGLEVTGKQGQFGSFEELMELCKDFKDIVPVIDFAHMYSRKAGEIDYEYIFKGLKKLNLKEYHFHFAGVVFTKKADGIGNEKHHTPISTNKPPFLPLAKEILKQRKDVTIISESPIQEQDSLKMKEIFEKLKYKF